MPADAGKPRFGALRTLDALRRLLVRADPTQTSILAGNVTKREATRIAECS
jgi:hypothetical protein